MKLRMTVFSILVLSTILLLSGFAAAAQKEGDYDWLKQRLAATKAYTLEVIKAMPDDKYDFRPEKGVRTYKEQAYHIVYSIDYYRRVFGGNPKAEWVAGNEDTKTRTELIAWAEEQFDAMEKLILQAPNNPRLTAGIMSYLDHNAHHRGQLIIYLRLNGIKAPSYR